jgi:hypothetical protein
LTIANAVKDLEKINAKAISIAEGNIALHVEPDNPAKRII